MWALVEAVRVSGLLRLDVVDGIVQPNQLGGSSQLHMAGFLDLDEQPAFPHLCFSGGPWGNPSLWGCPLLCAVSVQGQWQTEERIFQKSALSLKSEGPDLAFLGFVPHAF